MLEGPKFRTDCHVKDTGKETYHRRVAELTLSSYISVEREWGSGDTRCLGSPGQRSFKKGGIWGLRGLSGGGAGVSKEK